MTNGPVHIVQHMRPGGIECLALEMQRRNPDSIIVSLEGTKEKAIHDWPRLEEASGKLVFLNKKAGIDPTLMARLMSFLWRVKPTAVHTHHIGPLLYGGIAARLMRVPSLVHTEHDAWHLEDPKRARLVSRLMRTVRPRVVSDVKAVAQSLWDRCAIPSDVIVNGVDTDRFMPIDQGSARRTLNLPVGRFLIGCAGRMEPEKNQAMLLDAFALIADAHPVDLVLAGDGSLRRQLEEHARTMGLSDRVRFLGRVEAMPEFYNAIDVFVLPSDKEGYPLSLLEAQATNTPVIATAVGGVGDAVCPRTGTLIRPGDARVLGQVLLGHLAQSDFGNPRHFALNVGSLDTMMASYERLYAGFPRGVGS